jgi:type II secretory pathway pseudopilin PulG
MESGAGGDISEKIEQLKGLVLRWQKCQLESESGKRKAWLEQQGGVNISAVTKAKEWLGMKDDPSTWSAEKRRHFLENILPPMQQLVEAAESAVQRSRQNRTQQTARRAAKEGKGDNQPSALVHRDKTQPSTESAIDPDGRTPSEVIDLTEKKPAVTPSTSLAPSNILAFPSGRVVSGGAEMTPWERMSAGQKNALRRGLFALRDSFVRDLNERLKKGGESHPVRCKAIADSLRSYLEGAMPLIIKGVQLTPSDTEGLVSELMTEDSMIKPE